MMNFKERHLPLKLVNEILSKNCNFEYKVDDIFAYRDKYIFKILNSNNNFICNIDFKIYDYTGEDIKRRLENLHNRIAYQEVKSVIHDNLDKLKNEFKGFRFDLNYEKNDRDGFFIKITNSKGLLNKYKVSKYYTYDSMYKCKNELINYNLLKETIMKDIEKEKKCKDCGYSFNITMSEMSFFIERDLEIPKRCESCRKKRNNIGGIK